jgi:hypothetical protein
MMRLPGQPAQDLFTAVNRPETDGSSQLKIPFSGTPVPAHPPGHEARPPT